jgi:hypothetical protein
VVRGEQVTFPAMLCVSFEHFRDAGPPAVHLHARPGRRPTTPPALATVQSLALLTAMFTVGHSVSLALAALGWVTLPSRCVKTGIAITIALGALNATACIEGRILAIRWLTRCSLGVGLERERCFDPTRRLPCRKCCY